MTQQSQSFEVAEQARTLATQFDADYEQTVKIIERLRDDVLPLFIVQDDDSPVAFADVAASVLRSAYRALPWQEAATLLEQTPAADLAPRLWVPRLLSGVDSDCGLPLFSLAEFADQLSDFRGFLNADRDHLLKTGLPSKQFAGSRWLEVQLAKCYPTRCTENSEPFEAPVTYRGEDAAFYWVKIVRNWKDLEFHEQRVPHDEADFLEGFAARDALRLEQLREQIFDLKLAVLEEAEVALRSSSRSSLWSRCLRHFVDTLSTDDVKFLLRLDAVYANPPAGQRLSRALVAMLRYHIPIEPGGFSNLIDLIGHVETECTIGTMRKTCEALEDLVTISEVGPVLRCSLNWPYFRFAGQPSDQQVIESAVRTFIECNTKEIEFRQKFHDRVQSAMTKKFEKEIAIRFRSKPFGAEKLRSNVTAFAELARNSWESKRKLPAVELQLAADAADSKADSKDKIPESDRLLKAIKFVNDHYKKVARDKAKKMHLNAILSIYLDKPVESNEVKNLARQLRIYRHLIHAPADS